jgi:hypothetical protein
LLRLRNQFGEAGGSCRVRARPKTSATAWPLAEVASSNPQSRLHSALRPTSPVMSRRGAGAGIGIGTGVDGGHNGGRRSRHERGLRRDGVGYLARLLAQLAPGPLQGELGVAASSLNTRMADSKWRSASVWRPSSEQDLQQARACGLVERIDLHQFARMRQRGFGPVDQCSGQRRQDAGLQAPQILAFREAPGLEVGEVRQVDPFEELAAEGAGELLQFGERQGRKIRDALADDEQIDVGAARLERDGVARGDDARRIRLVDQGAQAAQTPAQRSARIVRQMPEHGAEPLAPMQLAVAADRRAARASCATAAALRARHRAALRSHPAISGRARGLPLRAATSRAEVRPTDA